MKPVSPIGSTSPLARPKITFNYPISPLKEKPLNENFMPNCQLHAIDTCSRPSLKLRAQPSQYISKKETTCLVCNKQATYKIREKTYCSSCYITQMKKSTDIELRDRRLSREFEGGSNKENSKVVQITPFCNDSEVTMRPVSEQSDTQILNDINAELAELQKIFLELHGIQALYKEKKLKLKFHYEKIKEAIKVSIDKDLVQLQKRQINSVQSIQKKKQILTLNINLLEKIKQSVEPEEKIITATQKTQYRNLYARYKTDNPKIEEERQGIKQLLNDLCSHRVSEQSERDSLLIKSKQDQQSAFRKCLYDPYLYTQIDTNNRKSGCEFSFEQRNQ